MNILIVGGTFSNTINSGRRTYGHPSGLIRKFESAMKAYCKEHNNFANVDCCNGGTFDHLKRLLEMTKNYDIVFWFANVSNDMPKIRDVKSFAPKALFITSKRNDNNRYSRHELIQKALTYKSDLVFEFGKQYSGDMTKAQLLNIQVFDPMGCVWYQGNDITAAMTTVLDRLCNFVSKNY